MKTLLKVLPYILTVLLTLILANQCSTNKTLNAKLDVLNNELKLSKGEYLKLLKTSDSILKIKNKTIIEYKTIYKYLKPIQDAQDNLPDSVYSLNERQIDRTIRTYKRPVRN